MKRAQTTAIVIIVLLVVIVVGIFYVAYNLSNKPTTTGNVVNEVKSECPKQNCPACSDYTSNIIMFQLSADFMGGDKFHTSATSYLDSRYCKEAIISKGYSDYQYCYIQAVQLLFGSDPNPFKSKNTGYNGDIILFGGEVFRVSCICSDKPQFTTSTSQTYLNLGLL